VSGGAWLSVDAIQDALDQAGVFCPTPQKGSIQNPAWLCQSFMTVLLPHGAFLTEDRLTFTQETAEPVGVSPPEAVDSLLIEQPK
jgi:hypothetical protein